MTGTLAHKLGVCQWFDFAAYGDVKRAVAELRALLERYGHRFSDIELWNQPTSLYRWDFAGCDPDWSKLAAMIAPAAATARRYGVRTVLGGMLPVDHQWLALMREHGALEHIDVVAIHGFPQRWWEDAPCWDRESSWQGWDEKIAYIRAYTEGRPVWVTETGSTGAVCSIKIPRATPPGASTWTRTSTTWA